jgi:hypothetical protein
MQDQHDHWLPRWLERRSWWVKWSFVGGLGLLSAFLPGVLGLSWQQAGVAVGVVLVVIAAVGAGWEGLNEWRIKKSLRPYSIHRVYWIALTGLLVVCTIIFFTTPRGNRPDNTPPLLKHMETDFPGMDEVKAAWGITFTPGDGASHAVPLIIYSDIRTNTKFIAFYVPDFNTFIACQHLATNFKTILDGPPQMTVNGVPTHVKTIITKKFMGDPNFQSSENEVFTGAAYIYYEGYLSDEERVKLRQLFKEQGVPSLMFRSREYLDAFK